MTQSEKRKKLIRHLQSLRIDRPDDRQDRHGVLLSNDIEHYVNTHNLITNFERRLLKPAAYELTVGDEFYVGGRKGLFDKAGSIEIPPFEVAVIKTHEIVNIPPFLIARWNLRAFWAYKGLLWVGAAQVDPGYTGYLYCPLYNLSDRLVKIPQGKEIAVIDFVKTTGFEIGESIEYDPPEDRSRHLIDEYDPHLLNSGIYSEVGEKIGSFENHLDSMNSRLATFTTITFAVLAIIVSASILLQNEIIKSLTSENIGIWFFISISMFSFLLSIFTFFSYRIRRFVNKFVGYRWFQKQQRPQLFSSMLFIIAVLSLLAGIYTNIVLDNNKKLLNSYDTVVKEMIVIKKELKIIRSQK